MIALLQKSTRKDKRYVVRLQMPDGNRTIHFGSPSHENYTTHKDPQRREMYLSRHAKRENWEDPSTAGYWSRWMLWEEPRLGDAMKAIAKKGITVRISKHL